MLSMQPSSEPPGVSVRQSASKSAAPTDHHLWTLERTSRHQVARHQGRGASGNPGLVLLGTWEHQQCGCVARHGFCTIQMHDFDAQVLSAMVLSGQASNDSRRLAAALVPHRGCRTPVAVGIRGHERRESLAHPAAHPGCIAQRVEQHKGE